MEEDIEIILKMVTEIHSVAMGVPIDPPGSDDCSDAQWELQCSPMGVEIPEYNEGVSGYMPNIDFT